MGIFSFKKVIFYILTKMNGLKLFTKNSRISSSFARRMYSSGYNFGGGNQFDNNNNNNNYNNNNNNQQNNNYNNQNNNTQNYQNNYNNNDNNQKKIGTLGRPIGSLNRVTL